MGTLTGARKLHDLLAKRVMRVPTLFFDTTPVGRILNRFSQDIDVLDNVLGMTIRGWLSCLFGVVIILYEFPSKNVADFTFYEMFNVNMVATLLTEGLLISQMRLQKAVILNCLSRFGLYVLFYFTLLDLPKYALEFFPKMIPIQIGTKPQRHKNPVIIIFSNLFLNAVANLTAC